jgi:hypothetical protein
MDACTILNGSENQSRQCKMQIRSTSPPTEEEDAGKKMGSIVRVSVTRVRASKRLVTRPLHDVISIGQLQGRRLSVEDLSEKHPKTFGYFRATNWSERFSRHRLLPQLDQYFQDLYST